MHTFSKKDLELGQKLLNEKRVLSVVFSSGTYQVEVLAAKKPKLIVWPFLQLSDAGEVMDAFCSCESATQHGSCPHIAASYLKMVKEEPLHVRFQKSLWNQIALICTERHGYESKCLKRNGDRFEVRTQDDRPQFSIRAKDKKALEHLETILYDRPVETEENSIKFSNLSQEELTLWRQGRPSPKLKYELCFWSDLAKWWMLLQEDRAPLTLHFSKEQLPKFLKVELDHLEIEMMIDRAHYPLLIPSLAEMDSPLKVHPYLHGKLTSILFLPDEGKFQIEFDAKQSLSLEELESDAAIRLGDWIFLPEKGFYPREYDPLLEKREIPKEKVSEFFDRHLKLIQKYLRDQTIHPEAHPVHYELFFDHAFSLHVCTYLFEKGDLQKKGSHFFGSWAYLDGKGFYHLESPQFKEAELILKSSKVGEFVGRNRVFLHNFEGFQTHVSGVESHLGYRFDENGDLLFYTRLEFTEEAEKIKDLGDWIYVAGKGFYEKVLARPGAHIKAGLEVPPYEISHFISTHTEELETIPRFFSPLCPLEKSGLHISFNEEGRIKIDPEFFFRTGYHAERVQIYGDYAYVKGEGFSLIPHQCRLPESYKVEKIIDRHAEPYFVSYELDLLYPHVLAIDPKIKRPKRLFLRLHGLKHDPISKTGSWILEIGFESEIGVVPLYEVWEAIWAGRSYHFSNAGLLFLKDRRFDWLRTKNKKRFLKKGTSLRLNTLEFLRLLSIEELLEPEGKTKKAKETRELLGKFLRFEAPEPIDLTGLKSDLRAYQKTGVDWLWFLHAYGLSGLLCDEMGLGKTHQAMGLIAGIKNAHQHNRARFLVVCPTSVIYHWEKLIKTFLPEVKPYIFHGIGRRFEAFVKGPFDLLLTSYGIVRTENKALSGYSFDLVVFDELQVAKNEKSLTHKALKNLDTRMRVGLSGTPIENRLLELKALFDLVVPSYLPSMSVFKELFVNPIEKYQDDKKRHTLSRLIRPFLLRRKKSEVLTELPEKIEEIVLCDLSEEQHKLYKAILSENRDALLQELKDKTKPPPIAHIFSMLSKLKQVCNHPSLVAKDLQKYKEHTSGKWELFLELLNETRDSGQKLVVFSQYLGMLDIIGMHLRTHKIPFAEIRGSTRDRKEQVERFDKDPKCEVFLGSLQAAGVGIDLIAASVVIHYDRWWNPAKENQATDRVHRMGQKRGVQVFKLVTKNTIEEHIHMLIERKLSLARGVIGFDDQDQIKGLEREELIELLTLLQ